MTEAGNPAQALEAAFRRIAAGPMAGLPIINPALAMQAVGFRPWQGRWVGVLITPWFMNLLAWPETAASGKLALPNGDYACQPAFEQSIGHYLAASLFSPMAQFADQAEAVVVAEAVLEQLFTPASNAETGEGGLSAKLERPLSRRGFLSALLPGEGRP